MNTVDVANFFDNVSYGKGLLVQFQKSITPLSELNLKDQKILDEARAWLNLRAISAYPGRDEGVLISMTKIGQRFYVYEKIIQDKDRPEKGNTLVKDEIVCKTYENSGSAMAPIIKSIKKYCPSRAHEFITFA
jgi:hypothetical protein|nr:MAG TPA: hypothetical protein [Caudoviricetes sp.]